MSDSVYVVIANELEKVKECVVLSNAGKASKVFHRLRGIYGRANVALISRAIDDTAADRSTIIRFY